MANSKKAHKEFFFQKYLKNEEYGIDILNDLNGNYVHHCCRKKILIRSGDTDKALIVKGKVFEDFAKKLSSYLKHVGIVDVDFIYKNKRIFISRYKFKNRWRLSIYTFIWL